MRILGIDPSIRCTGWCVLILGAFTNYRGEIKPQKIGVQGMMDIEQSIEGLLSHYAIDTIIMERMFYSVGYGDAIANVELSAILKRLAYIRRVPIVLVGVSTLKKFVTGSGKSKKNEILREAYRKWKVTGSDHVVEAYALAKIGEMISKKDNKNFVSSLKNYEKEVLKTICPDKVHAKDKKAKRRIPSVPEGTLPLPSQEKESEKGPQSH